MSKYNITLELNGVKHSNSVDTEKLLLNYIREDLHLTGTKESCGEGECGSCTVIMDGKAVNSCLILAVEADESKITTIEGLEIEGNLDSIQQGFIELRRIPLKQDRLCCLPFRVHRLYRPPPYLYTGHASMHPDLRYQPYPYERHKE